MLMALCFLFLGPRLRTLEREIAMSAVEVSLISPEPCEIARVWPT